MITRVHLYLGLLSVSHFAVYGIAGLTAALQTNRERPKVTVSQRFVPFRAAAGKSDKQIADEVYRLLDLPFSRPMPDWFLKRDPKGLLRLDFYNINGIHRVTVEPLEGRVRIEEIRNSVWLFLEDMHAMTGEAGEHFRLLRIWGWYNRFASWSLLAMTVSGVWIWGARRGRTSRFARMSHRAIGLSASVVLLIYGVSAMQMTGGLWTAPKVVPTETRAAVAAGLDDGQALLAELRLRGLAAGELDFAQSTPSRISLRATEPWATYDVTYDRETGGASIRSGRLGPLGVLNRLHRTAGLWHASLPNRIWNGVLILVSLGLLALGGTGVWLWFGMLRERLLGSAVLAGGVAFSLALLLLIRYP